MSMRSDEVQQNDAASLARHGLDASRVEAFLRQALPELTGPLAFEPLVGGQSNPTFLLRSGTRSIVLRKQPPGALLPSAHAVDREYRVMKALSGTGVPVPRMLLLCQDTTVTGTLFYMMEAVEGRVFHDCALP